MHSIERYISQGNITEAMGECVREGFPNLGLLLGEINKEKYHSVAYVGYLAEVKRTIQGIKNEKFVNIKSADFDQEVKNMKDIIPIQNDKNIKRVRLLCNWCSSEELCNIWNNMSKGDYTWENVRVVWDEPCDYVVIINCPSINYFHDKNNTILFRMEPNMHLRPDLWGEEWAKPNPKNFLKIFDHENEYNNNEWHLSKSYNELLVHHPNKTYLTEISTVLSDKYHDEGHIKRIDFVKFLDTKSDVHIDVYGSNKYLYKNYQSSLPPRCKDEGLFPYKYTFNVENQFVRNYYSEKLIDGILSECLVFYHGCPNIRDYIDSRAFVWLELNDFEKDYEIIKRAINEDWWTQRLPYIREMKEKILNHYSFFPRLERIIKEVEEGDEDKDEDKDEDDNL